MFIIVYNDANKLFNETKHIGPFNSLGAALEYITDMPKVGKRAVRYVAELEPPTIRGDARLAQRKASGHQ